MKLKLFLSFICIFLTIAMFVFIKPPQNVHTTVQISPFPTPTPNTAIEKLDSSNIYENPAVIHLRKALDNYLSESYEGINVDTSTFGHRIINGSQLGLDSFEDDYYKSKFVVLNFKKEYDSEFITIDIIFVDKADRSFRAMLEMNNNQYSLIAFGEYRKLTESEMIEFKKSYKHNLLEK